jgi:hypothetical protein
LKCGLHILLDAPRQFADAKFGEWLRKKLTESQFVRIGDDFFVKVRLIRGKASWLY